MKTPMKRVDIGKPITPNKRRRLAAKIKKREEQLRKRFREIHGKVVDWVNYVVEDRTLYVSIRFKDKTDFSLYFYPRIITDRRVELCDSTTDDFEVVRLYEGKKLDA